MLMQALHRVAGGGEERPQLLLEGFDAEQVWLQLDAQLKGAAQRGRKLLRKAGDVPHLLQPGMQDALQGVPLQHTCCLHRFGQSASCCAAGCQPKQVGSCCRYCFSPGVVRPLQAHSVKLTACKSAASCPITA